MTAAVATDPGQPGLAALILRETLADAYRDAALAGADMAAVVAILEEIRSSLTGGVDLYQAWQATSGAIGSSGPGPLRPVLVTLRDQLHARLLRLRLDDLDALPAASDERARAWLELLTEALVRLHAEVVAAISGMRLPDSMAPVAHLAKVHQSDLVREDYGLAFPLFETVARHPLLTGPLRASIAARCAEIQVLRLNDPAAGRAWLDGLPPDAASAAAGEAADGTAAAALVENAWGGYWMARGDLTTARGHLLRAVDLNKTLSHPYRNLGDSYVKEDDQHAAATWFESARTNCPGSVEPYTSLLTFNAQPGRIGQHRDQFPELIELAEVVWPYGKCTTYLIAATAYHGAGDAAATDHWLARAAEADPDRPDVPVWKSNILAGRGKHDEAFAVLEAADRAAPGRFDISVAMANLCVEAGRIAEVPSWIRRALDSPRRLAPEAQVRLWLAEACRQAGDLRQAETELIGSLRLEPCTDAAADGAQRLIVDCQARFGRAAAEELLGRISDVLGPEWAAWHRNGNGDLDFAQQRYPDAAKAYRAAIELAPDVAIFKYNLAAALRELNDFDQARASIKDAVAVGRNELLSRVHESLVANAEGNYLFNQRQYAEAIPRYQEAIQLQPRDVVLLTNLAGAWDMVADPARRRETLEGSCAALSGAAELAPADTAIKVRLAGVTAVLEAEADFSDLAFEPLAVPYTLRLLVATDLIPAISLDGNLTPEVAQGIADLRARLWAELGVALPYVNFADDPALPAGHTRIEFDGVSLGNPAAMPSRRFSPATSEDLDKAGVDADLREQAQLADGTPGWWLAEAAWGQVEQAGLSLASPAAPILASVIAVINANLHHLVRVNAVAQALGPDAAGRAPDKLAEFTRALGAHLTSNLPITDTASLWQIYLDERAGGATVTAAVEALRRSPPSLAVIRQWCQAHPPLLLREDDEAWMARRVLPLRGGPALPVAAGDEQSFLEVFGRLRVAGIQGFTLVTRDPALRPLIAWGLHEARIMTMAVLEDELPAGVVPASWPATAEAGEGANA
jgi:tetratricopeptide (TPR) repeat protein